MKIGRVFTLVLAAAGLLAFAAPAQAQMRGGHRGGNPGGGSFNHGGFHRGDGGRFFGNRGGVNVFFGTGFFGWPYWGYPYWGYPYGYAPYGYYYGPPPYYAPASDRVYDGRMRTNDGGGKDVSVAARVQQHLARNGFYHGPIDGIVGDGTRRAIRSYQRANGLPVDGRIDDQLLGTMGRG
jgi:hypothetical protein